VIVADTSAVVALLNRRDRAHARVREALAATGAEWVIPWAVLPEVDHIVRRRVGAEQARAFTEALMESGPPVEWGSLGDLRRAAEIDSRYADLGLGLVDTIVMATAERLRARAIVTLDERDFAAVELEGAPAIWPRDLD
jgi:predicted nucleic acid-binding protein